MARQLLTLADFGSAATEEAVGEVLRVNLARCHERLAAACERASRSPQEVDLLVVSKYVDLDVTRVLYDLGVRDFGENRVQEGLRKREFLDTLGEARVHFIGHLQRNKAKRAVTAFDSIQSLDSPRLAEELERCLGASEAQPRLFIEINVSEEEQKTGLSVDELPGLLEALAGLPRVRAAIAGLMGMAPYDEDPERSRPYFRRLRELHEELVSRGALPADADLSMGMSGDFEVAVEEGATVVRVGSALYEAVP